MTVRGHDFILNCRACFCREAFATKLEDKGGVYSCPRCGAEYEINKDGFLTRV